MTVNPDHLEVEVKFLVADLDALRTRLVAAGATHLKPRIFEKNIRFDTVDNVLAKRLELLRVRQDTAVKVTFKRIPHQVIQSEAKIREELEIEVSDFETTMAILARLGFEPKQIYEKYRETFQLGNVEVVLDEMPFGTFVELEGEETSLKMAAVTLSLDWSQRILANYLALMAQVKAAYQLPFDDLTFANFEGLDISMAEITADL